MVNCAWAKITFTWFLAGFLDQIRRCLGCRFLATSFHRLLLDAGFVQKNSPGEEC